MTLSAPGPVPLTYTTVGLNPNPCTASDTDNNWNRLAQIPMMLQNQINDLVGGLTTILDLSEAPGYDAGGGTPPDGSSGGGTIFQVLTNVNNVIQWLNPQQFLNNLIPGIGNWNVLDQQVLWNNAGTYELKTLTSTSYVTDWRYNDSTSHKFQTNKQATFAILNGAATGLADTSGSQPSSLASVVTDVEWNSPNLQYDNNTTVFVLEVGTHVDDNAIDTAVTC